MMMKRAKQYPDLYPHWQKRKRKKSSPQLCRERDNNRCVDCSAVHRTVYINAAGELSMYFLHASHLHKLDPEHWMIEPIEGQRLQTRCPRCHRIYDVYWKRRQVEVEHQRVLHTILLERAFIMGRFTRVV